MIASTSKLTTDKSLVVIGALLTVSILAAFGIFNYVATNTAHDKQYINLTGEERVLSQSIVKDAVEASSANVEAFKQLKLTRNMFEQNLNFLRDGNPETGLPPSPESVAEQLDAVSKLWNEFGTNADTILQAEGTIRMLSEFVGAVNETMPPCLRYLTR